jgi:rubredoxin
METVMTDVRQPLPQFECAACGYGASCRIAPERCPMCGGSVWELAEAHWLRDLDAPLRRDRPLHDRYDDVRRL